MSDAQTRRSRINRLRRQLTAKGFRLIMSRRRKAPFASGGFLVLEMATGQVPIGGDPVPFSATLEAIEEWAGNRLAYQVASRALVPDRCIAARLLLGWSMIRLGAQALFTEDTVRTFEAGSWIRPEAAVAIRTAIEAAGVEFIAENGGGAGVRLRAKSP